MKITIPYRFICGIDISKLTLAIYLYDQKLGQGWKLEVSNQPSGFSGLGDWLAGHQASPQQTLLCSEHTGRYSERLLRWSTQQGWPHGQLKTTTLQKVGAEHHRKTDAYDARMLAEYGCRYADHITLSEAPKPTISQLKRFRRARRKMVDRRTTLKQKQGEAEYHDADMSGLLEKWSSQEGQLSEDINWLEGQIAQLISNQPRLQTRYKQMRTAPGIGEAVGSWWVSEYAGRTDLQAARISSRFGFAPHPYRSGSSVSKSTHSSGYGRSEVRKLMYLAAQSVANHYAHYRHYYNRKQAEGKPHDLIINNIINKLIDLYCTLWNKRQTYDPNYMAQMEEKYKKTA